MTFCAECGPGVSVDEDGLCANCGATASGNGADRLGKELRDLKARAEAAERRLAEMDGVLQGISLNLGEEIRRVGGPQIGALVDLREAVDLAAGDVEAIARRDNWKARAEAAEEERDALKAGLAAMAEGACWMDAPGHPVCHCGKPSVYEAGLCAEHGQPVGTGWLSPEEAAAREKAHDDFRRTNDAEWLAKVDYAKAERNQARAWIRSIASETAEALRRLHRERAGDRGAMSHFDIGATLWPGLSKLIEEAGEVQQVCGKLIASRGETQHWDGTDLRKWLQEEIADVMAACRFVAEVNDLDVMAIAQRAIAKEALFRKWHAEQQAAAETT